MFRFNLEKVLTYRTRLVEAEARKLRNITAQLEEIMAERRDLEAACDRIARSEVDRCDGELDMPRFRHYAGWLAGQREFMRICDERAREVQVMLENQRSVLLKMKHDESVLKELKERHRAAWAMGEARTETKSMDEAASRARRGVDDGESLAGETDA